MKHLLSVVANSFLIMVLFAMLFLPIGSMGLSSTQTETQVLSETDYRETQPRVYVEEQTSQSTTSIEPWQQVDY